MPDKDQLHGYDSEDYEFFCEKGKPHIGEPVTKISLDNAIKKVAATIVMLPLVFCLGLICIAVAIGPILISLCAVMIGLCAAAIGASALVIEWAKFKIVFYWKYLKWHIESFWWRKKNKLLK